MIRRFVMVLLVACAFYVGIAGVLAPAPAPGCAGSGFPCPY